MLRIEKQLLTLISLALCIKEDGFTLTLAFHVGGNKIIPSAVQYDHQDIAASRYVDMEGVWLDCISCCIYYSWNILSGIHGSDKTLILSKKWHVAY